MVIKGGTIKRQKAFKRRTKKTSSNLTPKHASLIFSSRTRTPKKETPVIYTKVITSKGSNPKKIRRSNSKRRGMRGNPRIKVTKVSTWGNN